MINLKKWMAKVSEKLGTKTGTLTVASGWTATQNWCRKRAGIVEKYIEVTGGTMSSGWNTVATLPEGFRPMDYFDSVTLDNGNVTACDFKTAANGNLSVYKTSTTSNNLRLHCTFLASGGGNKLPYPLNRIAQILRRKEVGVVC